MLTEPVTEIVRGDGTGHDHEREGGGRDHVVDTPDLETEDWNHLNNLDHRNTSECQIRIPEELMENPDSTRENPHLTPELIQIIL